MSRLAILAGRGALPHLLAEAQPDALYCHFEGLTVELPRNESVLFSYERFGEIFQRLGHAGVTDVVFAGGLARPALNPANFDDKMRALAPGFLSAMQGGDDGLLRAVITAFEAHGFRVRGAHEVRSDLTTSAGLLVGAPPAPADLLDIKRAMDVLKALGALDVGQGAVVAKGEVLGIETSQGTDAMLRFVAETRPARMARPSGVLVKAPKDDQDLRIDMPAIGPDTIIAAAAAGLTGIVIEADHVLLLERSRLVEAADRAGLFVSAENP